MGDNRYLKKISAVVFCTGYDFNFDFIEDGQLIKVVDNQVDLWKRIFSPQDEKHSMAVSFDSFNILKHQFLYYV